ncbi:Uncharacterized protein Fot_08951 [Forsythia ovata]|uniref:Uncharacterized protein n=1 Tax=Forsythia ovata TaxID=205694 RepID=A0ABD1WCM0_9LAMI
MISQTLITKQGDPSSSSSHSQTLITEQTDPSSSSSAPASSVHHSLGGFFSSSARGQFQNRNRPMEVKDIEPSEIETDEVYMVGLIHTSLRQSTVVDDDDTQHHQLNCLIPSVGVDKFQTRDIRNDDDDFEITPPFHMKTSDIPTSSKQPRRKRSKSPKSPKCTWKTNCGHLNEEMMKILTDVLLKNQKLSVELLKMKS